MEEHFMWISDHDNLGGKAVLTKEVPNIIVFNGENFFSLFVNYSPLGIGLRMFDSVLSDEIFKIPTTFKLFSLIRF